MQNQLDCTQHVHEGAPVASSNQHVAVQSSLHKAQQCEPTDRFLTVRTTPAKTPQSHVWLSCTDRAVTMRTHKCM